MIAYHFCGATLRDGRPIPADGEWLIHEGPVTICESGLHASAHPFDALQYAPGATLCLVECDDVVAEQDDKLVCRRRKIVKRIDATDLLWKASREYAKSVLHLWDAPQVVKDFLETGDESLRAAAWAAAGDAAGDAAGAAAWYAALDSARAAAWAAARAATWDVAWAAAWASARAAARDAAWVATWDAAWDATWDAALDSARVAARDAAWAAAWAVAWAVAGAAARAAAWDAQRELFKRLVDEAFA